MKSILDPSFRYYNSVDTDLRRTFARVRREIAQTPAVRAVPKRPMPAPVVPLRPANLVA